MGGASDPQRSASGYHVLVLLDRSPGFAPPLSDVQEEVRAELRRRASERALRDYLDDLRARADVRVRSERREARAALALALALAAAAPAAAHTRSVSYSSWQLDAIGRHGAGADLAARALAARVRSRARRRQPVGPPRSTSPNTSRCAREMRPAPRRAGRRGARAEGLGALPLADRVRRERPALAREPRAARRGAVASPLRARRGRRRRRARARAHRGRAGLGARDARAARARPRRPARRCSATSRSASSTSPRAGTTSRSCSRCSCSRAACARWRCSSPRSRPRTA